MNYIIRFSANAESDAEEIGDYYEKISPGLSIRFFKDINTTIAALKITRLLSIITKRTAISAVQILISFLLECFFIFQPTINL